MLQHYDSGLSEALLIHSRDTDSDRLASEGSFFSVFRKLPEAARSEQRTYRMPFLEDVVRGTVGCNDTYIGQCSFYKFSRKSVHFKHSRVAWVDLDLYNIKKELNSATVAEILGHAAALGIPPPTAIVSSGRGCYLKWNFQVAITQYQLPVWQTLQAVLNAAFSTLAADTNARDASRVLRLLDTKNSASGKTVEVIDGCGVLYDFNAFCQQVEGLRLDLLVETTNELSVNTARKVAKKTTVLSKQILTLGDRGDIEALNLYTELHRPIMLNKSSEQSLNWTRFCDLRNLYEQRGGIPVGERDKALFWMLNFLSHARVIHSSNWEREIHALSSAFPKLETFRPATDGSMHGLHERLKLKEARKTLRWKGQEVSPLYRPGNRLLIDVFNIKPEEMTQLATIISPVEKLSRIDKKAPGRQERRFQRNGWQSAVAKTFAEQTQKSSDAITQAASSAHSEQHATNSPTAAGVNISALARHLGVERTRVSRYWHQLADQAKTVPERVDDVKAISPTRPLPDSGSLEAKQPFWVMHEIESGCEIVAVDPGAPEGDQDAVVDHQCRDILEAGRLARLAAIKAVEAKQCQDRLAFERRKLALQDSWARRQLAALVSAPAETNGPNEINHGEHAMVTTPLSKKKALLQAARAVERGELPALSPAAAGSATTPSTPVEMQTTLTTQPVSLPNTVTEAPANPTALVSQQATQPEAPSKSVPVPNKEAHYQDGPPEPEQFDGDGGYGEFFNVCLAQSNESRQPSAPVLQKTESKIMPSTPLVSTPVLPGAAPVLTAAQRLRISLQNQANAARTRSPQAPSARCTAAHVSKSQIPVKAPISQVAVTAPVPSAVHHTPSVAQSPSVPSVVNQAPQGAVVLSAAERLRANMQGGQQSHAARISTLSTPRPEAANPAGQRNVVGAPSYYPTDAEWPSDVLPPGSNYSLQEWKAARTGASGERYDVLEMHSPDKSFLVQLPIAKADPGDSFESVNDLMRKFYSGCLLVDTNSFCAFPDASEGEILQNSALYRVIRPRGDYIQASRAHRIGTLVNMDLENPQIVSVLPLQDGDIADDNRNSLDTAPSQQ